MGKTLSLVELARKTKPRQKLTWFTKLPAEHQKALLELKEQWTAKVFGDLSWKQLYDEVIKPSVPGICAEKTLREWMAK